VWSAYRTRVEQQVRGWQRKDSMESKLAQALGIETPTRGIWRASA
jgi:hypothetical protein